MPPEQHPAPPIFISYSRTDLAACVRLRDELEKAGLNVFQDKKSIRLGDRWLTELQDALQQCSAFVLLIGKDGIRRWVGAEVEVALMQHLTPYNDHERLPIFPILLDDIQPESLPPFLALFQADCWKSSDSLPDTLIEAIKARAIRTGAQVVFEGCPYLGLSAFGRNDARLFFGRRRETLEALTYLGDQQQSDPEQLHRYSVPAYTRWLQIEGNSGSGKSSLVNAGMLPLIERGTLWARTGFEHWRILGPMMPGKTPLEKLAETLEQGLVDDPVRRDSLSRLKRLRDDSRALAFTLKDYKQPGTAFLLIVDQFEELFTFADDAERKQFDALLAIALTDAECPLFLIDTVRADFLDRFEYLPQLQSIYNTQCKRYFLSQISTQGLQDIIEQPARLARLDVSEITHAIINDAKDEIGALPLVENALLLLWQQRQDHKLSGKIYHQLGGIAGMLSSQADALLSRIDQAVPQGKLATLELLLRLTRINDEGRHTRQRISLDEAVFVAGNGDDKIGRAVVDLLSGQRDHATMQTGHHGALRLITTNQEQDRHYVDLIHETLIRARKDVTTGKSVGYWPTLYDYIDNNRDRDHYRQLLTYESQHWQQSRGLECIWNLRWSGLKKFRELRIPRHSIEGRFIAWSRRAQLGLASMLVMLTLYGAESIVWVQQHSLSPDMIWTLLQFRLGHAPLPVLTEKAIPPGAFNMGEQDAAFIAGLGEYEKYFGVPGQSVSIEQPFYLSQTEITYEQYDYYVWQQHRAGNTAIAFPNTAKGGRGDRPVVNVSWFEAKAYSAWLSTQTDRQCRLPTEGEWEYAARADTTTAYHWGDEPGSNNANCAGCDSLWDNQEAAPVASFSANPHGLYDMSGNVWEWTCSNWREQFDGSEQHCNNDMDDTQSRVVRGGSWINNPANVRSSVRIIIHPFNRYNVLGFRVLCSSPIE